MFIKCSINVRLYCDIWLRWIQSMKQAYKNSLTKVKAKNEPRLEKISRTN